MSRLIFARMKKKRKDRNLSLAQKPTEGPRLADVTVDTRNCLSMLRRVSKPQELPDIPAIFSGPFLN